jgi:hypothetical protein
MLEALIPIINYKYLNMTLKPNGLYLGRVEIKSLSIEIHCCFFCYSRAWGRVGTSIVIRNSSHKLFNVFCKTFFDKFTEI